MCSVDIWHHTDHRLHRLLLLLLTVVEKQREAATACITVHYLKVQRLCFDVINDRYVLVEEIIMIQDVGC